MDHKFVTDTQDHKRQKDNNLTVSIFNNYKINQATLNYLNNYENSLPYAIDKFKLQSHYGTSESLEEYIPKVTFRSKELNKSTLRPRHVNLLNKRVPSIEEMNTQESKTPERKSQQRQEKHFSRSNEQSNKSSLRRDMARCFQESEFGPTMQQYCFNSTLHGLKYVGDSTLSICERIFWILSFASAVATAAYYIWISYNKWSLNPIIISLSPEPVSLTEIPFPSVTICNMNNVKKSEATRINQGKDNLEKLFLDDLCDYENNTYFNDLDEASGNWSNVLHFMINVSQSCNEMLYLCQWHGNTTDCTKIFNPTMTDEGICCNFNSVIRKYLFYNPRDWSDLNMTFPFPGIDWNPETGYDESVPKDSTPWRPYGAGKHLGLTLVLDAELDEYYCSSTASAGFKMLLHNPVETPKIADYGFSISPGTETRIIVTPRMSTASRSLLKIPKKQRKCFFTSERRLKYYRTYTQSNCVLECEANFTQKMCQCVQHYMPKSMNTLICGKKDELCARQARKMMELKLFDDEDTISLLNVSQIQIPSCNCWPGCFEISYEAGMSESSLSSSFKIGSIYVKNNEEYFVKNMAVVHLYFVHTQFTKFFKNELFGFTEFLASTGGLLGLFMGFSILSLIEAAYFLTIRLWCRIHRQDRDPNDASLRIQPVNRSRHFVYPFIQ